MKNVKRLMTITLILVLCVILYYRYANKDSQGSGAGDGGDELSEVEKVLTKDLGSYYPQTPLEVVKFFVRIQKCYYNEDNTDAVVEDLADMARSLMDEKLLEENPKEQYYEDLKKEIKEYRKQKRTISNVVYDKRADVVYYTMDDVKMASLNCTYYIQTGSKLVTSKEKYILKRNDDGQWKIYGWMLDGPSQLEK